MLHVVSVMGEMLKYLPEDFKKDKEVVLVAVSNNGLALEYASEEFKSDR